MSLSKLGCNEKSAEFTALLGGGGCVARHRGTGRLRVRERERQSLVEDATRDHSTNTHTHNRPLITMRRELYNPLVECRIAAAAIAIADSMIIMDHEVGVDDDATDWLSERGRERGRREIRV